MKLSIIGAPVKHKKTGKEYFMLTQKVVNTTNSNDGQKMVLYCNYEEFFVREELEFCEKFELTEPQKDKTT